MDEHETVVDDEGTARCNFLNIRPVEAEDEGLEDNQETATVTQENRPDMTRKKDSRWMWLLLLAVMVAAFLYVMMNKG